MFVLDQITVNLNNPGQRQRIYASIGDSGTRAVEVKLITNDGDWLVPEGVSCVIRFAKADGHQGVYYTLPDGSNAWNAKGNVLTVGIAAQVLTCPGIVAVSAQLVSGTESLGIFGFDIHVVHDQLADLEESSDYFSVDDLEEINAALAGIISGLDRKAPAGYGLGDINGKVVTNANEATRNGWYTIHNGGSNLPGTSYGGSIHVKSYSTGNIIQHLYYTGHGGGECRRICTDGTWGQWEYVTPPAYAGVEYRTTERWNGKVVYTIALGTGQLPNNSVLSLTDCYTATNIIRASGATNNGSRMNFPAKWQEWDSASNTMLTKEIGLMAASWGASVFTNYDASSINATIQVWYTKD